MRLAPLTLILFLVAMQSTAPAARPEQENPRLKVEDKVTSKVRPFALQDVRLLAGPLREAMERDQKYLLALDPDRLLHTFRLNAGLPSAAKPLGGWEAPDIELRGHSLGHFLSACALMYASTGDNRFKAKADAMVTELAKIQAAQASRFNAGYLSAFPEEFFDRVDARKKVWAPYYTLHKIMAGLLDMYQLCGNRQALEVVEKMAGWVKFRVDRLTDEQQQKALDTEHGGMNEVLANLYAATGNAEYLRVARKFDHRAVFDPLARGEDPLNGLHANTQIPKAIGAAREYELTGDARDYRIASFFWERVAHHRSFVIGGNSDDEHFFPVEQTSKHIGRESTETCNTYNMLKLTRHLFAWSPSTETMDFYERGLFNHILASQDPETGMICYYVPLKQGTFKTYSAPEDSFWCCVGTGMENHAKYGDTIYYHDEQSLLVNLFIASELNWKEKGLVVRQETRFPDDDGTWLTMKCAKPTRLTLKIRYPSWARAGMKLTINGNEQTVNDKPGSYVSIAREWKDGDTVQVRLPMQLHVEAMPDDPKMIAILYGPIVLAGDLGDTAMAGLKRYGAYAASGSVKTPEVPAFVCDLKAVLPAIKPVAGEPMAFRIQGVTRPGEVRLVPFYKVAAHRYSVYWNVYSVAEWEKRKADIAAAADYRKEVERRTIDVVGIGDKQSESDHHFQGERSSAGHFEGRAWRAADEGGWFAYELKTPPGQPATLLLTYWGSDFGGRVFDVLVEGEMLGTQKLDNNKPGEFFDVEYRLPERLTQGKAHVTVKFQAHPKAAAGGVFDVRLVRQ